MPEQITINKNIEIPFQKGGRRLSILDYLYILGYLADFLSDEPVQLRYWHQFLESFEQPKPGQIWLPKTKRTIRGYEVQDKTVNMRYMKSLPKLENQFWEQFKIQLKGNACSLLESGTKHGLYSIINQYFSVDLLEYETDLPEIDDSILDELINFPEMLGETFWVMADFRQDHGVIRTHNDKANLIKQLFLYLLLDGHESTRIQSFCSMISDLIGLQIESGFFNFSNDIKLSSQEVIYQWREFKTLEILKEEPRYLLVKYELEHVAKVATKQWFSLDDAMMRFLT